VPSASHQIPRLAVLGACAALLGGVATGCSTTQEKAERQQAESKRILDARAKRQQAKKDEKSKPGKNEKGSEKQ
jgi:hypothetical protein